MITDSRKGGFCIHLNRILILSVKVGTFVIQKPSFEPSLPHAAESRQDQEEGVGAGLS